MSRVLIIFAHPSHKSYNFSILQKVVEGLGEKGHAIQVSDLHALKFDPAMTEDELYRKHAPAVILGEQSKIIWADIIILIFPVWWWGPPAILKGWLERVLCLDFAFRYDVKHSGFVGMLQDRKSVIISTGSSDPNTYPVNWQAASHTDYVGALLVFSGLEIIKQMHFYNIHQYRPPGELKAYLSDVYSFAKSL